MRWLIGVLLVSNILVFLWASYVDGAKQELIKKPTEGQVVMLGKGKDILPKEIAKDDKNNAETVAVSTAQQRLDQLSIEDTTQAVSRCWEYGNFPDRYTAEMEARLIGERYTIEKIVRAERMQVSAYYALILPAETQAQAHQNLLEARGRGVNEAWMLFEGPYTNGISLGVHTRRAVAERRAKSVRSLGIDATVRKKMVPVPVFRVEFSGTRDPMRDRELSTSSRLQEIACTTSSSVAN